MNNQKLIIYQFTSLYQILKELEQEINFQVIEVINEKSLNDVVKNLTNYLIISKKKILNNQNQFTFNQLPINFFKFVEKINVKFLKQQFNDQSQISISKYKINLNSREMLLKNEKLKLTEKEVNTIIYLSKAEKPISIDELQTNVWGYQLGIDTHTVETHIYRLRKKILETFGDKNFIVSKKNGYQKK